jgi:hypothetical protein
LPGGFAAGQAAVPLISFKTCKVLNEIRSTAFKGKKKFPFGLSFFDKVLVFQKKNQNL